MTVLPDPQTDDANLAPDMAVDPTAGAGRYMPAKPADTAMDGSPARRPGDADPAPKSDGAPIFSTDPLVG